MQIAFGPGAWLRHRPFPVAWDALAALLVIGVFVALALASVGTFAPLAAVTTRPVSLDPARLPDYAVRTVLRMLGAMAASLLFTFTYGTAGGQEPARRSWCWSRCSTSCSRCRSWASLTSPSSFS